MRVIARVYGRLKPVAPDILIGFDISSQLSNGHWHNTMTNVNVKFQNDAEPIDEVNVDNAIEQIKNFIEALINSPAGKDWVQKPDLHVVYDDEINNIRIMETSLLFQGINIHK